MAAMSSTTSSFPPFPLFSDASSSPPVSPATSPTTLPGSPPAVLVHCDSTFLGFVYGAHPIHDAHPQAKRDILCLLEIARNTTLCEIATNLVDTAQQTQRTTLEWLLHQVASPDFSMGEHEICHRITLHMDVLRKRLQPLGLDCQRNQQGVIYIQPYQGSGNLDEDVSTNLALQKFSGFAAPTEQRLTAINVAKGLSIYQYVDAFLARHTAAGLRQKDQVSTLWGEICTLYTTLASQPLEALQRSSGHPLTMASLICQYFALSKAPGVEAKLTAILRAEKVEE
ncbi:hypothetical protein SEPCBS119000_003159 [Sporothrix epigloea]|uniref:Uncharacterized protein n=1 Tax=Sporothrix epigloea TaxID=1892477 RepID=A0ABP0DMX3_9PEZI